MPRGSAPSPREAEIRHTREGRSEKEGRDEQMTESVYHRSRHLALLMSMFRAVHLRWSRSSTIRVHAACRSEGIARIVEFDLATGRGAEIAWQRMRTSSSTERRSRTSRGG